MSKCNDKDTISNGVSISIHANGGNVHQLTGHIFGVAKATIVHEVCDAIMQVLMKKYIKFPSGNQLTEVLNGFERCHSFPQCVGAVDGTHIEILAPEDYKGLL